MCDFNKKLTLNKNKLVDYFLVLFRDGHWKTGRISSHAWLNIWGRKNYLFARDEDSEIPKTTEGEKVLLPTWMECNPNDFVTLSHVPDHLYMCVGGWIDSVHLEGQGSPAWRPFFSFNTLSVNQGNWKTTFR